ncbi:MAG: hypothetical protein ACREPZ_06720 [Rhodanobacteraceae bacterium]
MAHENQDLQQYEIQQTAAAIEKLAADPKAFRQAYEAFVAGDAAAFGAALSQVGISDQCRWVCRFFCRKRCAGVCRKFCPKIATSEVNAEEILAFTKAVGPLLKDSAFIRRLCEILRSGKVDAWNQEIQKHKLQPYCYQLCVILCLECCGEQCRKVCPPDPLITRVANVPIAQIDASGYGHGPDALHTGAVPVDTPAAGVGDHPFGGAVELWGIFNFPAATEYRVEVATAPGGPYSPVLVAPQWGYDSIDPGTGLQSQPPPSVPPDPPPPALLGTFEYFRTRSQSGGGDPGWFQINQIQDSDGGRLTSGEKVLLTWSTSAPDGVYYLRLRVRDAAMNTRVSSPQVVRLDNTGPFPLPRPIITLQLLNPDGTLAPPLKCGKVRKRDGLIQVTIQAYDPNMSQVAVTARGNSGLSVPVVSTTAVPLSKTYNGNVLDQGYVVPTTFLWDPWSDPNIVPCCYLIYVEVWDRTIVNGYWSGGHYNAGWEAIQIAV